ncbi:endo-1 4-beta-xylanase A [Biomphalaria glabrata]|nr:endo-1; 4-beta-xylanase A-like [Biomphalaria glabrata]KAI8793508.1 endo-1,4-beta-xylanase A [Biomphalaria glabrata]
MARRLCQYFGVVYLLVSVVLGAPELLTNPGFESGLNNWVHDGFTMTVEKSVVHSGTSSVKCTGRGQSWMGPGQYITPKPGGRYAFSAYLKLINDISGTTYQNAAIKINFKWKDTGADDYYAVTSRPFLNVARGWVHIGADFQVPNREYTQAKIYLEGLAPHVDFYFDDATLTEIPEDRAWKAEANQRIESLRKSNIHFKFNVGSGFNVNDLRVEIDHKKHLFGFGSQMPADYLVNPDFRQYQNIAYYMFNWATIEQYKWPYNRGTKDNPDFSVAVAATDELRRHGLNVRGHCMFWSVPGNQPSYASSMTGQTLKDTVDSHIRYMTGITKGKLSHWDVNNELLHGRFFETHTGDEHYSYHIFQAVHAADPKPTLFLNDYNVVAYGEYTLAYLDQIQQFKAANVGLGAVGIQSHFPSYTAPDPTLMKYRLDLLAKAGLPMWVTELDLSAHDENTRADWYETALRLYFSHPSIEGIIFWGFWDHDMSPNMALVHGNTFALDKAGERYLQLTKHEWSTHVNRSLSAGTSFDVRGFQGDYDVIVWYQNKPIKIQSFSVGKSNVTVNVDISGNGQAIHLPTHADPFVFVPVQHATTSNGLTTEGHATSTSTSHQLTCTTHASGESEVGDDKEVEVGCGTDEVLTGCSGYLKNNDWHKDGERIVITNNKPSCKAVNGYRTTAGIKAYARCCKLSGLTCTYKVAGPSGTGVDDQVVAPCASDGFPLGCTAHTYMSDSDGSFITNTSCVAQNDGVSQGVYAYAACCKGGNIKCTTVHSAPSGHPVGARATVTCPAGQVMTGCTVYSTNAKAAGSFIEAINGVDTCVAVNGYERFGHEEAVRAYASCCSA